MSTLSTFTTRHLTTDQLNIPDEFYDVPVCWIGEDGDALAVTPDRRRGLAAIHALARRECATPARGEHDPRITHARFQPYIDINSDITWIATPCQPDDNGAIPVVLVHELTDYHPRPLCRPRDQVRGDWLPDSTNAKRFRGLDTPTGQARH